MTLEEKHADSNTLISRCLTTAWTPCIEPGKANIPLYEYVKLVNECRRNHLGQEKNCPKSQGQEP